MKQLNLAGVVIFNKKGELLLLHRNSKGRCQWEVPGGKVEENEIPIDCAKREALEELGVKVEIQGELGSKEFEEDGYKMLYIWFKALILSGSPSPIEVKHDKVQYFPLDELNEKKDLSPNAKNLVAVIF